jgi:hypothetical protein
MTMVRHQNPAHEAPRQEGTADAVPARKAFVEPKVSSPVDVLEATTFFQTVDSGGTGIRRRNGD